MIGPAAPSALRSPGRGTVLAAFAFIAGLLTPSTGPGWLPLTLASLALVVAWGLWRRGVRSFALVSSLLLAVFLSGWGHGRPAPPPSLPTARVWLAGTVRIPVESASDGRIRIRLSFHRAWSGETVYPLNLGAVAYLDDTAGVRPGDEIQLIGTVSALRGPRNPGDFDERGYWANRDVQVRVNGIRFLENAGVQRFWGGWTRRMIADVRNAIARQVDVALTPSSAPLARALLIGDRSVWEDDLHDRMARSGLMHLFAVSGLHVGIILVIVLSALSLTGLGPRRNSLLAVPFLLLLIPLTGSNPPVVRAAVILSAVLIGRGLQRDSDPMHLLALSCMALLAWRPAGIGDVGFQLSFAGAAGSLWAAGSFRAILIPRRKYSHAVPRAADRTARRTAIALIVSCFAWLATAPILIAHFGRIAWLGPLASLPALGLVTLALTAGWVMVLTAWWPWLSATYGAAMDLLLRGTDWLSQWAAVDVFILEHMPWSQAAIAVAVLVLALGLTRRIREAPFAGLTLFALGSALIVVYWTSLSPDDRLKLAVLDVGQGDAVLIRSGQRAVLIDGGPVYSTAAADQCRRLGIDHLDLLLLSHGDADHSGALPRLLETVTVGAAIVGPGTARDRSGRAAIQALIEQGTPVYTAHSGARIHSPTGRFTCLFPPRGIVREAHTDNDLSAVWLWESDGTRAVFAGDAGHEVERWILEQRDLPAVNLLLAGHHGSRHSTSTAWLDSLQADLVAISCGLRNPHNHPSPDVLARIQRSGATIHRTDRDGALLLTVSSDGLLPLPRSRWW